MAGGEKSMTQIKNETDFDIRWTPEVSRVAQDLVGLMGPASTTKTQPKTQLKLKLIWARRRIIGGQDKGRSSVQEDEEEDIPNTLKRRQTRNVCFRQLWVKNDYVTAKRDLKQFEPFINFQQMCCSLKLQHWSQIRQPLRVEYTNFFSFSFLIFLPRSTINIMQR